MGKKRGQKGALRKSRHARGVEPVRQAEPPLLVFISSAIEGMEKERATVEEAVESIQITRAWRFEVAPASSEPVEEAYLSKVRGCDLFILVVGTLDRTAVRREYQAALEAERPVLAFVEDVQRSPELGQFVGSIGSKYRMYASLDELKSVVRASVADEITRAFRATVGPAHVRGVVEALSPPQPARKLGDLLGYIAFGVESDLPLKPIFTLFGGECRESQAPFSEPAWDDIVFDDLDEMKDVFDSLSRVMAGTQATPADTRPDQFLVAWENEVLRRASRYMVRRKHSRPIPRPQRLPGFRYLVLGVHHDYAPLVRLMRPQEILPDGKVTQRDGEEVVFRDIDAVQQMLAVMQEAQRDSSGDPDESLSIVLAGAMRARLPPLAAPGS
jgi:hypothetical protein